MGASIALAGATACTRQPDELIVPYVRQPEDVIPGKPLFFATTMTLGGIGTGLLAESHMGRPTKLEGNPDHPSSVGATDLFGQGTILTMYDPDRTQSVMYRGEIRPWGGFVQAIRSQLAELKADGGAGLALPLRDRSGRRRSARRFASSSRRCRRRSGTSTTRSRARTCYAGAALAFGAPADVHYRFDQADVIVALDADVFGATTPGNVRYARDFANGRRVRRAKAEMNRLYVAEPTPTPTGSIADHRLPRAREPDRGHGARAERRRRRAALRRRSATRRSTSSSRRRPRIWRPRRQRGLVVVGERQPPAVHALALAHQPDAWQPRHGGGRHRSGRRRSVAADRVAGARSCRT